ncbi:MAG: sulfite exporter TauE/SafE family protein [Gammaproteobacteria bacterium]|nr:sulfite exporter TauE/SafE family protein [Gammaproteobacteria bacterium]MBK7521656.1 sulfite exporter TauE/SafE family protein [Gammaproteobacteria bacterium]MBK9668298.1 sulfite exporter TauE/SafE family protein [Gammaproteobacteria bacterium]
MITAIALGVLVGLVLGLTGAGGSIFAVPLLMWGLGWTLPQAVPVALLAVCIGAGFGTVVAWDVRLVRYRAALLMALAAWLMAPFGLHAARVLAVDILTLSFALVLLLVGVRLLIQASRTPDDAAVVRATVAVCHLDPGTGRFDWTPLSLAVISAIGALTGFLSGMLGVGGGFVIVPSLRAATDLSMHSAVATSLMAIALISGGTVGVAVLQGQSIPWLVALPFVAGTVIGMSGGRHVAARIAGPRLQQGFAGAMLVVAVAMAWPLLG